MRIAWKSCGTRRACANPRSHPRNSHCFTEKQGQKDTPTKLHISVVAQQAQRQQTDGVGGAVPRVGVHCLHTRGSSSKGTGGLVRTALLTCSADKECSGLPVRTPERAVCRVLAGMAIQLSQPISKTLPAAAFGQRATPRHATPPRARIGAAREHSILLDTHTAPTTSSRAASDWITF